MSEKIRFEKLKLVCRKALEQSIKKSLSLEQIKSCYPLIASTNDGVKALEVARQQIIQFWFDNSLREFDVIFEERDIQKKLDSLDELVYQAEARKDLGDNPIYINELTPDQLIEANLVVSKKMSVTSLSMIQDQLKLENEELLQELKSLASEANHIKTDIENISKGVIEGLDSVKEEEEKVREKLDQLIDNIVS